jgi:hypothetical protein
MTDTGALILVGLTFPLAGGVKGVIGLGLPTFSLAILTATLGLHSAMALLVAPSLVINVWQALVGGNGLVTIKRIWPLLVFATVTVWIGAMALTLVDVSLLSALLGVWSRSIRQSACPIPGSRSPGAGSPWRAPSSARSTVFLPA